MPLLRRRKLDRVVKDAYWDVVIDALCNLFGVPASIAGRLANDRRAAVDLAPTHLRSDIFYHNEPFGVASELAKSSPSRSPWPSLDDPQTRADYETILGRHGLL